jgi:methylmalonyl-CoA mutase cobalamin-binding subunit
MKKMLIGAIGTCVHAAGVYNFSRIAAQEGYSVTYLGSANPIDQIIGAIIEIQPEVVALGYRLSAEGARQLLQELEEKLTANRLLEREFVFGGTIETALAAQEFKFIHKVFNGTEQIEEIIMYLRQEEHKKGNEQWPQTLRKRIQYKKPFPLIRHHIGLNTLKETAQQIEILADSGLLDVISLAPDQNCQQYFFEPDKMNPQEDGAGGVPIRQAEDLVMLYQASRRGNYPLVRCYSGTNHLVEFSQILKETINNAWAAIPLTWYSDLDRRSQRGLVEAITENQQAMAWNAHNQIPVEVNESHQWALRYCNDAVEVATAYLSAYSAKKMGVQDYIQQLMLCNPPSISPAMDLAKMLAKLQLIQELEDEHFKMIRMIRTGLLAYPADPDVAKGLVASTMFYGAYLQPDIVHAVSYTEAIQRATAKEILETVKIVKKALSLAQQGTPDYLADPAVAGRVEELKDEARVILAAIKGIGAAYKDPLAEPEVICQAIKLGILDAPGLKGFSVAKGAFYTEISGGKHVSVDEKGRILTERERLARLGF